jgi:energy-coupling factor transporter ATP-binding protein EcfA2
VGHPRHTGTTVAESALTDKIRAHYGSPIFISYWAVGENGKGHIEKTNSLSGFDGPLHLHPLILDIDGDSLGAARARMLSVTRTLRDRGIPDEAINVWFSGGKGYHIHLPGDLVPESVSIPDGVKGFVKALVGPGATASTQDAYVDVSLLGDSTKLIRAPWSKHEETERYKVPIRFDERSATVDDHTAWASSPEVHRKGVHHRPCEAEIEPLTDVLPTRKASPTPTQKSPNDRTETTDDAPLPHYVTCMHHLAERGPVEGRRHNDMLRLAAANAFRGLSRGEIEASLKQWLHAPEKGLPMDSNGEQDAKDMALRATGQHPEGDGKRWDRYQCDDDVMSEFCDEQCLFYKYREEENPIATDAQRTRAVIEYLTMTDEDGVDVGRSVGSSDSCVIHPGEIATFYGNTGMGKTALMQSIVLSHNHLNVLDITTEMSLGAQETRYLQIKENLVRDPNDGVDEVEALMREVGQESFHDLREEVSSHVSIMTSPPELSHLERHIREEQADVIVIDPVGKIRVDGSDHKTAIRSVYKEMTDIATRLNVIFLCVRHIRKSAMGDQSPDLAAVKGYKEVTEESEFVFAFGGARGTSMRTLELKKCNRPLDFDVLLEGTPETYRFRAVKRAPGQDNGASNGHAQPPDSALDPDRISNRQALPT